MLFKNTSKKILSICASGRGFTVLLHYDSIIKSLEDSVLFFFSFMYLCMLFQGPENDFSTWGSDKQTEN